MSDHVAAVNALTAAWARRADDESFVLSGAGLWPLLGILATSADEPGRSELAGAVGVPADDALAAAALVLATMDQADGVDAALGLWAQRAARIRPEWRDSLAADTYGELAGDPAVDQPMLDAWARDRTHGLIEKFPIKISPQMLLTIATALAVRTTWQHRFSDARLAPSQGLWRGRELAGLTRTTPDVDDVRVADTPAGPVTITSLAGDNGLDVHLVLGEPEQAPGAVVPAAIDAIGDGQAARSGYALLAAGSPGGPEVAPGVSVVAASRPGLQVETVRFSVTSDHDLMRTAELFGLTTVSGPGTHFSRIGEVGLKVDEARQSAVAIFSALGFEAAAVTAIAMRGVAMPRRDARALAVAYDRPFGFVATHRSTGLVLFAGWVTDPEPWKPSR